MPKWTLDESIAYAKSQLGETDGRKYAKIAVGWASPYDWCAYFDSAIKVLGELDCPYFPSGFAFDKRDLKVIGNRWVEPRDLQAGDFIGFDWDGGSQYGGDHVGYVVQRVAAGDYWTVEGNCGGAVRLKHRTIENTRSYNKDGSLKGYGIIGGIRPRYKEEEVTEAEMNRIAEKGWAKAISYKNGANDKPWNASAADRLGYIDYDTHTLNKKLDTIIELLKSGEAE